MEIANLKTKLESMSNASSKMRIKEKCMVVKKKNEELRGLDMEKGSKIAELQMEIENENHQLALG